MRRPTLIVMVKVPVAGRVKTRLGRDIGMTDAVWWYRHQTQATLRRLRDPRWTLCLAVAPDHAGMVSRVWPEALPRIPQGPGDLGRRMARALAATQGPTVLIGSDIPGVTRTEIRQAFVALGHADSVIGPATDGGFWLIGLRHPSRQTAGFLEDIRWSHEATLSDTLATLPERVATVATLADVDTAADMA